MCYNISDENSFTSLKVKWEPMIQRLASKPLVKFGLILVGINFKSTFECSFDHKVSHFARTFTRKLTYHTLMANPQDHNSQRKQLTDLIKACVDKVSQAGPNTTQLTVQSNNANDYESNRSKSVILPSEQSLSKPAAGEIEDIIKSLYNEKKAATPTPQAEPVKEKPKEEAKVVEKKDDDDYDDDFDI